MKKFIYSKNQELLEKHPTLWNTKIVWMLSISLILHIIFYLLGMLALVDPESLQTYNALDVFFSNGMIFISTMVSILLLVLWLISLFRNNSFKNFYPNSRWKLFKQFAAYFIIFLATTTFYYSYTLGLQTYITTVYDDARMEKDIALTNSAAPFFSFDLGSYELDQLRSPSPFDKSYCVTAEDNIDLHENHFKFKENYYQFYSIRKEVYDINEYVDPNTVLGNIHKNDTDRSQIFYFKDKVIDVGLYVKTSKPSYYNYKKVFFGLDQEEEYGYRYDYEIENNYDYNPFNQLTNKQIELIKKHQAFLKNEDRDAYNKLFTDFINLTKEYQIATNLSASSWMDVAYTSSPFELKELIHKGSRPYEPSVSYQKESDFTIYEKSIKSRKLYLDASSLSRSLNNIEKIKNKNIFEASIHVFLWMAFFFACIVFIFRTTSLKSLLFSIVASILLMIFVGLITALYGLIDSYGSGLEYFIMYFVFLLGTAILLTSLLVVTKIRKIIGSIFMNITLIGFVPYLILILAIIETHQNDWCSYQGLSRYSPDECSTILDSLGEANWSYAFLIAGIVFVFFYCQQILKWRASPEG